MAARTRWFDGARPDRAGVAPGLTACLWAVALAVMAELVVQRVMVRVGVHIPALPFLRGPYALATEAGGVAFTAAAILVVAALPAVLWAAARRLPVRVGAVLALSVLPFLLVGLYAGLRGHHVGWELLLAMLYLLAVVVLGAAAAAAFRSAGGRLLAALLTLGLALGAFAGTDVVAASGYGPEVFRGGETAVVAAALLAPLAFAWSRPLDRRIVLTAGAAGVLLVFSQLGNRATTNILLLWGAGMTGGLPFYVYGLAVMALALAIARLLTERRTVPALGLLFLAMGGYGLHNTYQSSVQILGMSVLLLGLLMEDGAETERGYSA